MTKHETDPSHEAGRIDVETLTEDDAVIGKAMKRSLVALIIVGAVVVSAVLWLTRTKPTAPPSVTNYVPPQHISKNVKAPGAPFVDITLDAGIDFVHSNGAAGDKLLPETMGGGVAFLDYDNDGDQDLLFVNSTRWPENQSEEPAPTLGFYRNDGSGKFDNVTAEVGLDISVYGMGAAVGDVDNDGDTDLFITAVGKNRLFRNEGGRFADATEDAGVAGDDEAWSTAASFVDFDNDGDLDLFVGNYVRWSRQVDFAVDYRLVGVGRAYGPPMNFEGTHPYLYRNEHSGVFTDVTAEYGLQISNEATGVPVAKTLGVLPIDVDLDGWIDLMVANDTVRNFFFHNDAGKRFAEEATDFGLAFGPMGSATGAMGIDAGNYRNDNELGIFIGNFANEMTSLYVTQGRPTLFADEAIGEGIGAPTRLALSFGIMLFDYDLDGRLDLLQVNGHLEEAINIVQPSQHYEQPPQLFWNSGDSARCFIQVEEDACGDLSEPIVGRGGAYADVDLDGDLDLVMTQVGRRPHLLRNDQNLAGNWVRLKLIGTQSNRDAIGARLVASIGDRVFRHQVMPTRSYLSQVELPLTIGLGKADWIDSLTISWPGGAAQTITDLAANRAYTIRQGAGVDRSSGE